MPWSAAQKAFMADGIPRSRGWDLTVARLSAPGALNPDQIGAAQQILIEHEVCGEKLVRVYEVDLATKAALIEQLRSVEVQESVFSSCFPAVLTEEEIAAHFPVPLTLVAVLEVGEGVAAIFAATRGLTFREEVDREGLPPAAREALAGYDEVLGIRQEKRQIFDVVFVPFDGNRVDVRVDFPDGMLRGAAQAAHIQVRHAFNVLVGHEVLGVPINLFPLIGNMYHASREGTVVELAFGTTTASTKYERMRRQHLCLREEIYHRAGSDALDAPIEPFRLSIQWSVELGEEAQSRPELSFQSTQRVRDSENPALFDVVVRNVTGCRDYDFVRGRLCHFLDATAAQDVVESGHAAD
jgi:hypothetical protein